MSKEKENQKAPGIIHEAPGGKDHGLPQWHGDRGLPEPRRRGPISDPRDRDMESR